LTFLRIALSTVQYEVELIAALAIVERGQQAEKNNARLSNSALSNAESADRDRQPDGEPAGVGQLIGAARTAST
jgi:hypothetical protein